MSKNDLLKEPSVRKLRIFAFDPGVAAQTDTAGIGEIIISIPWESDLQAGPVGEYLEIVDADPASGVFYKPVNLNDPRILAENGLAPSERNPQFHQQMVYAVAMTTINHFEQALGRVALWSSHRQSYNTTQFVRRLRIYPHALRDRNAYYSPAKKALLFGYFPVNRLDANNTPGTLVFTALSHDIIAHETTHALLDGVHPRFNEPVNRDVLAFHEAFADIVALFQHFSYSGVLKDQIARTRGNLAGQNLLGQLAQQFGQASGRGSALRDALGGIDPETNLWKPHKPDVRALEKHHEPHARGAILVAAVFGAFIGVYKARSADLYRIASDGTGVLRDGEIHPDLANRLAAEAQRAAQYTLQMCIRALDYCPPVGITFGDYLRAIITADHDLNPEETLYRLYFVESFRKWGIHPRGLTSMSLEGLLWPTMDEAMEECITPTAHQVLTRRSAPLSGYEVQQEKAETTIRKGRNLVRALFRTEREVEDYSETEETVITSSNESQDSSERMQIQVEDRITPRRSPRHFNAPPQPKSLSWNLETDRAEAWKAIGEHAAVLWAWLMKGEGRSLAHAFGLVLEAHAVPRSVFRSRSMPGTPAVEIHSVRCAIRRTPRGRSVTDLVVEITQRRAGYFDEKVQQEIDAGEATNPQNDLSIQKPDFIYRAGCTLLFDPVDQKVRRVIRTPGTITDNTRLEKMRSFLMGGMEPPNAFASSRIELDASEPFALLHQCSEIH